MTEFTARDVHPPLYFWVLHVWVRLAGTSEFAIRLLSVFFGVLSSLVIYSITWQLTRRRVAATVVMLLIIVSPFHIEWSQDARMYTLATMFAGIFVYAQWSDRIRLLVIGGIGTVLTHYFGAIVIGVMVLHRVLYYRAYRRGIRLWVVAMVIILGVGALWGSYAIGLIRKDPGFATFEPVFAFQLMASLFTFGEPNYLYTHFPYILGITTVFFLGMALYWRESRHATSLIVIGAILPPAFISLLGLPFSQST